MSDFCDPMDPSVSSVHGILQARILEWVSMSFYRGLPDPGIEPGYPASPALQVDSLPTEILGRPIQFFQFSSVAQSCLTLGDPMNRSTPGLPVHHQLLESTQNPCPLSPWCHPAISSSVVPFSHLQSFPASGSFPMSQLFSLGGQSIGDSASTSVLPMNTQAWFPLEQTGWISLQSKRLSRVFSNTTVQKHQFFGTQLSLYSNRTSFETHVGSRTQWWWHNMTERVKLSLKCWNFALPHLWPNHGNSRSPTSAIVVTEIPSKFSFASKVLLLDSQT